MVYMTPRPVSFRWEPEFVALIDEKRGDVPRSKFVRRAVETALGDQAPATADGSTGQRGHRATAAPASPRPPAASFRHGPKREATPIPKAGKEKR